LTQPIYSEAMAMGLGDQDNRVGFRSVEKIIVKPPKSGT